MIVGNLDHGIGQGVAPPPPRRRGRASGRNPSVLESMGPVRSASTSTVRPGRRARARARVRTRVVRPSARWQLVNSRTLMFLAVPGFHQAVGHLFESLAPLRLQHQHDRRPAEAPANGPGLRSIDRPSRGPLRRSAGSVPGDQPTQEGTGGTAARADGCGLSGSGRPRVRRFAGPVGRGRDPRRGVERPAGRRRGSGPRQLPSWAGSSRLSSGRR